MTIRPPSSLVLLLLALSPGPRADAQPLDLCQGLVQDKEPRPMTALAKPALGQAAREPQFGTLFRRVTQVAATGGNPVIKPAYSTTSAWNADESRLVLYQVGSGHQLYDGRDYTLIRRLPITPNEIEGFFWHTTDPDLLFYTSGNRLLRHHVSTGLEDVVRTFACSGRVASDPHGFTSWDSNVFGLRCSANGQSFFYRLDTDAISGLTTSGATAPLVAASGTLGFREGNVVNTGMVPQRALDVANPNEHASLGRLPSGHDTYNAVQFDPGPRGSGVGTIVSHDMATGTARVIVGPATGFPYPPTSTHLSALAYRRPGWVFASIVGNPAGKKLLDNELVLADTSSGKVCRVGRHRSFGPGNTRLGDAYWAEPHVVASPSGTRALFASDWGNGATVDTYALELPSYVWFDVVARAGDMDGDGRADLLWVNHSTGQVALWLMNGTAARSTAAVRTLPDRTWQVVGTGDYNGDDRSDILLRRRITGEVRVWLMNGATVLSESTLGTMPDPLGVAGSGDMDSDGRADILWYHGGTGALSVWLMNGTSRKAQAPVATLGDLSWRVVALADFDGDGASDLLLRRGATGDVQVWLMNGARVVSQAAVATLADASWQILGAGDYDGDRRADILLLNRTSGSAYLLLMNGTTVASQGAVATVSDPNWRITGSGDFDGNGTADLLWRHRTAGASYVFFMNGLTVASGGSLATVADQTWQVVQSP